MDQILQLLQIADSALPIGSVAHSYGLEAVIAEQGLTHNQLSSYITDVLRNSGAQDAWLCHQGHRLTQLSEAEFVAEWIKLNETAAALRAPHELRTASEKIGRRLLQLVAQLHPNPLFNLAWQTGQINHAPVFGLIGGIWGIESQVITAVFLQQMVKTIVSAAQRLQPIGQKQATMIIWDLKPTITEIANQTTETIPLCFPGLPELASLRHPHLSTRLFIS